MIISQLRQLSSPSGKSANCLSAMALEVRQRFETSLPQQQIAPTNGISPTNISTPAFRNVRVCPRAPVLRMQDTTSPMHFNGAASKTKPPDLNHQDQARISGMTTGANSVKMIELRHRSCEVSKQ
jgi:hypothetical protein